MPLLTLILSPLLLPGIALATRAIVDTHLPALLLPPWVVLATRALADPHLVTIVAATLDLDLSC